MSARATDTKANGFVKVEANVPKPAEKANGSVVEPAKTETTVQPKVVLSGPDRLIFRLNKLFAPTKDLGSVLTTFNYALYLLAYLDYKASGMKSKAFSLFAHNKDPAGNVVPFPHMPKPEFSSFARLGTVVSSARATLRLFGLLPIYVRARQLMRDSKTMDGVLYAVGLVQCSLYGAFQLLENIAFLTENKVLSRRLVGHARVATLYRIAHRAWFLGVMCDFVRLIREAQLFFWRTQIEKGPITEEEAKKAAHWYYDWVSPLAWLPIGWQLSAWSDDGVPGFNLGLQGVAGVLADLRRTTTLWHATADV